MTRRRLVRDIVVVVAVCALIPSLSGPYPWRTATARAPASSSALDRIASETAEEIPAAALSVMSQQLGRDDPAYHMRPDSETDDVLATAINGRNGLVARFTEGGEGDVRVGQARLVLRLDSWGYGDQLVRPGEIDDVEIERNELRYLRGPISEWYVNGPAGMQHGFTLDQRPPGPAGGPLTLTVDLGGSVSAQVTPAADGLKVRTERGAEVDYANLLVVDSADRQLPAWLALVDSDTAHIRIRDDDADYPILVDPLVRRGLLTATDADIGDAFGGAAAWDGDTLVVGVQGEERKRGVAYVFERQPGESWLSARRVATLTSSLRPHQASPHGRGWRARLGTAVAIEGDTIVVGAPGIRGPRKIIKPTESAGAVLVYQRPTDGWHDAHQTALLTAAKPRINGALGTSVAIDAGTIVAGAPGRQDLPPAKGAVYVFVKGNGSWRDSTETAKLSGPRTHKLHAGNARLGTSVAIDGDTIAAGAPTAAIPVHRSGAVYVFHRQAEGWVAEDPVARLRAADYKRSGLLGASVAIDNGIIVAGAPAAPDDDGERNAGAVYVFTPDDRSAETVRLAATPSRPGSRLGTSVAISGRHIVAGAPGSKDRVSSWPGVGIVFERPSDNWLDTVQKARLASSGAEGGDNFGASVAIDGDSVLVGAPLAGAKQESHGNRLLGEGASFVYAEPSDGWRDSTETAVLTADLPAPASLLGASVAVADDVIVAGAPGALGGALYVFARPEAGWATATQSAKLTASDGGLDDQLGYSVSIDGDGGTIVAGAPEADGSEGAVYVFTRHSHGWKDATESAKLTSSDNSVRLGRSVDVDQGTVIAGTDLDNVLVFSEPVGGWQDTTETAVLYGDESAGTNLGAAIAIAAGTIVVGAPNELASWGAVWVYVEPPEGWAANLFPVARLSAAVAERGSGHLGTSVAISPDGTLVVAGAPADDAEGRDSLPGGSIYVFERPSGGWQASDEAPTARLAASDGAVGAALGDSVAISGEDNDVVVAGAPQAGGHGRVYVFLLDATPAGRAEPPPGGGGTPASSVADPPSGITTETEQRTAPDPVEGDQFGAAVAVDDEVLAVGAPGRDELVPDQGAVFVFSSPEPVDPEAPPDAPPAADPDPSFAVTPARMLFGETLPYSPMVIRSIAVVNTGDTLMENTTVTVPKSADSVPPDYRILRDDCTGRQLAPGADCIVEIGFQAKKAGERSAVLRVVSGQVTQEAELVGKGTEQSLSVNPSVCKPGCVAEITGAGFPPSAPMNLLATPLGRSAQSIAARTDDLGGFSAPVMVFPRSGTGPLDLLAVAIDTPISSRTTLLVVPGSLSPPDYVTRR